MKKKNRENFQIFIISRFLVMLIIVILSDLMVLFSMNMAYRAGLSNYPKTQFFSTLLLLMIPIVGCAIWFAKIVMEEVQRMEQQEEELRLKYEKARNLMLSDIAHDLRTPITTIAGYSKALNDGMVLSQEKQKEYLEAIENKSERMGDLINLLFEYVRLDSENFSLKLQEVDLCELLRENAALLYADVEEKEMEFQIEIPEEVCKIKLDKLQVSRVITNLINNALKHNDPGTEITLCMVQEKDKIQIVVADNGVMITPMIADHIFEPFVVADASRESKGGSGLGLSIAKKIVEMHGWNIELKQDYEAHEKAFVIDIKK